MSFVDVNAKFCLLNKNNELVTIDDDLSNILNNRIKHRVCKRDFPCVLSIEANINDVPYGDCTYYLQNDLKCTDEYVLVYDGKPFNKDIILHPAKEYRSMTNSDDVFRELCRDLIYVENFPTVRYKNRELKVHNFPQAADKTTTKTVTTTKTKTLDVTKTVTPSTSTKTLTTTTTKKVLPTPIEKKIVETCISKPISYSPTTAIITPSPFFQTITQTVTEIINEIYREYQPVEKTCAKRPIVYVPVYENNSIQPLTVNNTVTKTMTEQLIRKFTEYKKLTTTCSKKPTVYKSSFDTITPTPALNIHNKTEIEKLNKVLTKYNNITKTCNTPVIQTVQNQDNNFKKEKLAKIELINRIRYKDNFLTCLNTTYGNTNLNKEIINLLD